MGVVSHMLAVTEVLIELPKLLWGDTPSDDNGYNMHKKKQKAMKFLHRLLYGSPLTTQKS